MAIANSSKVSPKKLMPQVGISSTFKKLFWALGLVAIVIPCIPAEYIFKELPWLRNPLVACCGLSLLAYLFTQLILPMTDEPFIKAGLSGRDMLKPSKPLLPESLGLISAVVYLGTIYLFMPFSFAYSWPRDPNDYVSALSQIEAMTLLGFADDVFDIRWRHKIVMPFIASIPLLMVYYISEGVTWIVVPYPLDKIMRNPLDLGKLYYFYMSMVACFCTNTINILAGINGVEVGQSMVLAVSLIVFNLAHIQDSYEGTVARHLVSLYLLIPFVAVSIPLLRYNWFPARGFVGDTYCYFSGMVFAVVGILGHFSKTLLLFFIPQIFNFIFSSPQLFHIIPCPRHRMPQLDQESGLLHSSRAKLSNIKLNRLQNLIIIVAETLKLVSVERDPETGALISMSNFTFLSFLLVRLGPMSEQRLTIIVMIIQALWSALSFLIRYKFVYLFYNQPSSF